MHQGNILRILIVNYGVAYGAIAEKMEMTKEDIIDLIKKRSINPLLLLKLCRVIDIPEDIFFVSGDGFKSFKYLKPIEVIKDYPDYKEEVELLLDDGFEEYCKEYDSTLDQYQKELEYNKRKVEMLEQALKEKEKIIEFLKRK